MTDDPSVVPAIVDVTATERVADTPFTAHVADRELVYRGRVMDVIADAVVLGDGESAPVRREYLDHPGAVAVIVLDDSDRILLQRQYRHPARQLMWEPPAGLLDSLDEDALAAAQRELAEEADLRAADWQVLVDVSATPGCSNETIRVFLARDLTEIPVDERFDREDEEASLIRAWLSIDDAVSAVLAGEITNPSAVAGILALNAHHHRPGTRLRPADAPWPQRRTGYAVS